MGILLHARIDCQNSPSSLGCFFANRKEEILNWFQNWIREGLDALEDFSGEDEEEIPVPSKKVSPKPPSKEESKVLQSRLLDFSRLIRFGLLDLGLALPEFIADKSEDEKQVWLQCDSSLCCLRIVLDRTKHFKRFQLHLICRDEGHQPLIWHLPETFLCFHPARKLGARRMRALCSHLKAMMEESSLYSRHAHRLDIEDCILAAGPFLDLLETRRFGRKLYCQNTRANVGIESQNYRIHLTHFPKKSAYGLHLEVSGRKVWDASYDLVKRLPLPWGIVQNPDYNGPETVLTLIHLMMEELKEAEKKGRFRAL